ncbi:MAG: PDZ domain-containing protein [Pyrinomonadaceae bacterium]|nr:PDZ domain-containing protein [Acidobacteriota bacterium]MBP7375462.1 PDZ domain-containing protein [Pyrinomonadaceae bacterium]
MYTKSLMTVLIVTSSFVMAFGQAPEAKTENEKAVRAFSIAFDSDGGYLGVLTQEVTKENFSKFGLAGVRGVAVEKVMENSPAQAAGLQAGDVIVRFENEEITSVRKLTRLISEVAADHQVKITVLRNNSEQDITATLGKRPMPKFENGNFAFTIPNAKLEELKELPTIPQMPELPKIMTTPGAEGKAFTWTLGGGRQIGVGVMSLTKQLAAHYGVDSGLLINDVRENSPAFKAGLKAGDIIVEAEGKAVKGDLDLIRTINGKKEGEITITYVRDDKRQTVSVTPEASKDGGSIFRTGDENGVLTPLAPDQLKLARPITPRVPMSPGAYMLGRSGRIL